MNWEKLKPVHYFKEPVEYFYASSIFDTKEYDALYENQNNFKHKTWLDFDEKYKTGFRFLESFDDINFEKEVICLWFFKERSNRTVPHVSINDKLLAYHPNTFLVTQSKNIKFIEPKRKYIRNPLVQLDLPLIKYKELLTRFNKTS